MYRPQNNRPPHPLQPPHPRLLKQSPFFNGPHFNGTNQGACACVNSDDDKFVNCCQIWKSPLDANKGGTGCLVTPTPPPSPPAVQTSKTLQQPSLEDSQLLTIVEATSNRI